MNEVMNALKVANTAVKAVRVIDITRKAVVAGAAVACCCFAYRLWRSI